MNPRTRAGANGGTTRLPPGRQWRAHCGRRQQERILLRSWRRIEGLAQADPDSRAARELLLDAVQDDPESEFAALQLGHAALVAADEQGVAWSASLRVILALYEKNAAADPGMTQNGLPAWVLERQLRQADTQAGDAR